MHPLKLLFRPLLLVSAADLVTLANGLLGLLAITYALDGQRSGDAASFLIAIMLLILAGIADGLDGYLARRFGTKHEYGVYLDSISDAVSFCLAPAIIIYAVWYDIERGHALDLLNDDFAFAPQWDAANLAAMFGAVTVALLGFLRLARFSHGGEDQLHHFSGMPTPSMAMFTLLIALGLSPVLNNYGDDGFAAVWPPLLLGVVAMTMMSTIPFPKVRGGMRLPVLLAIIFLLITVVLHYRNWEYWIWCWYAALLLDLGYMVGGPVNLLRSGVSWRGERKERREREA